MSASEARADLLLAALDDLDAGRVAHAIARVIARNCIATDRDLRNLDALGQASAVHALALEMAPSLAAEAEAAVDAIRAQLIEARKAA